MNHYSEPTPTQLGEEWTSSGKHVLGMGAVVFMTEVFLRTASAKLVPGLSTEFPSCHCQRIVCGSGDFGLPLCGPVSLSSTFAILRQDFLVTMGRVEIVQHLVG